MTKPSDEQLQIIDAPLMPMSVTACAGSGKTFTAVHRLANMRRRLGNQRGRVALLSFSNTAVNHFRQEYRRLIRETSAEVAYGRVEIETLDSFITRNVLRPHGYRTMRARQAAFLVTGGEAFLKGFKFHTGKYPRDITDLQVGMDKEGIYFSHLENDRPHRLDTAQCMRRVHQLGQLGAYTHNLGRYWCYRTLSEQPDILRALVRRFPHILIDEAQDIGLMHQVIIDQLIGAGCRVSLIGDPCQGIYEFAGADGNFLVKYGQREGVDTRELTTNFRSVPPILDLANRLAARTDTANREAPETAHGAFFATYRNSEREKLVSAFESAVLAAGLKLERSAILCRGREMADKLAGNRGAPGQGVVKRLAHAAILREQHHDYLAAFKLVSTAIVSLFIDPPERLAARLTEPAHNDDDRSLRRLIWAFTRDSEVGLPAATLAGRTEWHPLLLERTSALLARISQDYGLASTLKLGNRLAKTRLPEGPLVAGADLAAKNRPRVRVDTVHQAKGESLDAVLYLTNREHARALLAGVDTEVGRIGYVAVTRTRNLLWLAIPESSLAELRPLLLDHGFRERVVG